MALSIRRYAPLLIAVIGFGALIAATAASAPAWVAIVILVVTLGLASAASPRRRRRTQSAAELYASDGYSDAYLGRTRPTHPHVDARQSAQYGPALPEDPMRLPRGE